MTIEKYCKNRIPSTWITSVTFEGPKGYECFIFDRKHTYVGFTFTEAEYNLMHDKKQLNAYGVQRMDQVFDDIMSKNKQLEGVFV